MKEVYSGLVLMSWSCWKKEFDLKYLEETEEPKEKKEFFIDNQGKKQPVPSNPLKFTKKD
jgi:hypothetical protein